MMRVADVVVRLGATNSKDQTNENLKTTLKLTLEDLQRLQVIKASDPSTKPKSSK